jgi:hypothetical protein
VGVADAVWLVAVGVVALAAVGVKQCGMGSFPPTHTESVCHVSYTKEEIIEQDLHA